jgi:sugar lactone lactonase YvrE
MSFPNALIFDRAENLYATDSEMGAIWRFPLSEPKRPAPWAQDELLAPFAFDPFGIPLPTGGVQPFGLPGANGIGFYPPNHLYVANTEKGLLVHVPIERDGHAGTACIAAGESVPAHLGQWVPDPRLWTMDGIAVDAHGQIYGVVPGFPVLSQLTGLPLSPLVRIDPTRGTVHLVPTHAERFHVPLSLAFGRTAHDRHRVYVTNAAFFSDLFAGSGPGLVCAEVGVPGFHLDESPDEPVGS